MQVGQFPSSIYRVSLKAIIRNDCGEVLMVKENDDTAWNLPGGGMEHGETAEQAMARELEEEVGYKGGFTMQPQAIQPMFVPTKNNCQLWVVFTVVPEHQDFSIGEHATAIKFINPTTFKDSLHRGEQLTYKMCVDSSFEVEVWR